MTRHRTVRLFTALLAAALLLPAPAQENEPSSSHPTEADRLQRVREAPEHGADGVRTLEEALRDEDAVVRAAAVQILWDVRGEAAVDTILPLADDPEEMVVFAAARVLIESDDPRAVQAVRKALASNHESNQVQLTSIIGDRQDERFAPDLANLLSRDSVKLRRTVVEALRSIGSAASFRPCMAATGDANPTVASSAVGCLEVVGDPAALMRLAALSESPQPEVRAAVASAIPALGGLATHQDAMRKLLGDPVPSVAQAGLDGLRRHSEDPDAVKLIEPCLSHADTRVRRSAVVALRSNPSPEANRLLLSATEDPDEFVRAAAIRAVGARDMEYALELISSKATDTSATVRTTTALTLGELGVPEGLGTLQVLARDGDPGVRSAAVTAAAAIGGEDAMEIVRTALEDDAGPVRIAAVRTLGTMNSPASRKLLRSTASGATDVNVRITAIAELGRLGDDDAIALLREAGKDESELVRTAARAALTAIQSR